MKCKNCESAGKREEKIKVLIVDDSAIMRRSLEEEFHEHSYEALSTTGELGLNNILDMITKFKPNVLIQDIKLPGFSGLDVIRAVKNLDMVRVLYSLYGYEIDEMSKLLIENNTVGISKVTRPADMMARIKIELDKIVEKKKGDFHRKLTRLVQERSEVETDVQNMNGFDGEWIATPPENKDEAGSEALHIDFNIFKKVRVIGLKLNHTKPDHPRHGSCLSVSYGCPRKCSICRSGNDMNFMGHFQWHEIVSMQDLVIRKCLYYDSYYWLNDLPNFAAIMGSGDVAFNAENVLRAMEVINEACDGKFRCNISTAFIKGVEELMKHVKNPSNKVVPNLQISLYSTETATRRKIIDSDENPVELYRAGLRYAKETGTILTVNSGLIMAINNQPSSIANILKLLSPDSKHVRVKFSYVSPRQGSGLLGADESSFNLAASLAEKSGVNFEIFDKGKQMGLESLITPCGMVVNELP